MKGYALNGRHKQKDAYDIYYSVRNFPDGVEALAEECRSVLETGSGEQGFQFIGEKFATHDGYGPTAVRRFVEDSQILGGRTPDQWQQDAFGQVDTLLRALRLRD